MLTWINAGCDVGLGLPKCQAMHPTSVLGSNSEVGGRNREVRCAPVNGHREAAPACPKGAMRGHQTIQNEHRFGLINLVWLALSDTHLFPYSVNT
jgi:hypothetical protein